MQAASLLVHAGLAWHAPHSIPHPVGVQRSMQPARARPGMCQRARLVGGASISRLVVGEGLPEFLRSRASDAPLMGAGSDIEYSRVDTDVYECHMPQIGMIGFLVRPVLTVRLERTADASLCIQVISAQIYLLTPGASKAQLLEGCLIDSANMVTWSAEEGGWLLTSDLELCVALELPRGFALPRASVERPASAILRRFCAVQCQQFLLSLEQSYEEWARPQDVGRAQDLGLAPS